jgi:orotidine-5'-phosphate decarboxylase
VGTQGGDAQATVKAGWRVNSPIIVNASRAVLYASQSANFADAARLAAQALRLQLQPIRCAA